MSERERGISYPNPNQPRRWVGLGELKNQIHREGSVVEESLDVRPCCFFCGTHTCCSALEHGRFIEVAAGTLMACPGGVSPLSAETDMFCAVCTTCWTEWRLMPPTKAISVHKTLKG